MAQLRRTDQAAKRNPIREAIATFAYERFVARGCQHGHDLDDWLAAEREFEARQMNPGDYRSATPVLVAAAGDGKRTVTATQRP
jgi:hypothetical protein